MLIEYKILNLLNFYLCKNEFNAYGLAPHDMFIVKIIKSRISFKTSLEIWIGDLYVSDCKGFGLNEMILNIYLKNYETKLLEH